jgi:hypothetical protein
MVFSALASRAGGEVVGSDQFCTREWNLIPAKEDDA